MSTIPSPETPAEDTPEARLAYRKALRKTMVERSVLTGGGIDADDGVALRAFAPRIPGTCPDARRLLLADVE